MTTKKNQQLYQKTSEELEMINQTWLNVPAENVPLLVCHDLKECMRNLLNCFLTLKKNELSQSKDLAGLVTECAEIDERFKKIDLRWIHCKEVALKAEAEMFCSSSEQVLICTWIANGIKKILDEEFNKTGVTTS